MTTEISSDLGLRVGTNGTDHSGSEMPCPRTKDMAHAASSRVDQNIIFRLHLVRSMQEILRGHPVPTANSKRLTATANRSILAADERPLQVDLVRLDRTVPAAGCVGSREPCPSTSTQRAAAQIPKAVDVRERRWKSRGRGGRPKTPFEIRQLIRDMSVANPLWGAPRIHGELLKLGIDVGHTTVAKYMARRRRPPSQGWKIFLRNHADGIASMALFVVPTISFRLLYGFLILQHDRRQILRLGVTAHPTAELISHQLTAAYGWKVAPQYIIRDRDAVYAYVFIRRLRAMSIRDRPTAPRSPWQNGYCERAIG